MEPERREVEIVSPGPKSCLFSTAVHCTQSRQGKTPSYVDTGEKKKLVRPFPCTVV